MKKFSNADQKLLATWSLDCALRVLKIFEEVRVGDQRPRGAIAVGRKWVRTGVFKMAEIRGASLGSHAAAREAQGKGLEAACWAARAAGQAVATAHVTQHAVGGAFYALKALQARYPDEALKKVRKEMAWQRRHLPSKFRRGIMDRLVIEQKGAKMKIRLLKSGDY